MIIIEIKCQNYKDKYTHDNNALMKFTQTDKAKNSCEKTYKKIEGEKMILGQFEKTKVSLKIV